VEVSTCGGGKYFLEDSPMSVVTKGTVMIGGRRQSRVYAGIVAIHTVQMMDPDYKMDHDKRVRLMLRISRKGLPFALWLQQRVKQKRRTT
jgi:hypothetical protein